MNQISCLQASEHPYPNIEYPEVVTMSLAEPSSKVDTYYDFETVGGFFLQDDPETLDGPQFDYVGIAS
jgi:hypothetical protein